MSIELNGTSGITNTGAYTGDGLSIADGAPSGALQIDTTGNAGLGVAPSAWASGWRALQVGGSSGYGGSIYTNAGGVTGQIGAGQNWYYNGSNNFYIHSAAASDYYQFGGAHVWRTAPSGTAGNPISFTQAMTIDAAGRLTTPYQPQAITRIVGTDQGSYSNRIKDAVIIPTSVERNIGGVYNSTNGRFTANVSGLWQLAFSSNIYTVYATTYITVNVFKNGASYNNHYSDKISTSWQYCSFCDNIFLSQNDYLEIVLTTASGNTGCDVGVYTPISFRLIG